MNPDPSDTDSSAIPKELKPEPVKWLAPFIAATFSAMGVALVQWMGDAPFDKLVMIFGKRLLLQLGLILICSLAYCIHLIYRLNKRKLIWKRSLYWARGDKTPFCVHCYESEKKQIHLNRFTIFNPETKPEPYACSVCKNVYVAEHGGDFQNVA